MPGFKALIAFSHLRWDFVYQRPQHLLSRLAARWPVTIVEEPVVDDGPARLEPIIPSQGVTVLRPHSPVREPGFSRAQVNLLLPLLKAWQQEHEVAAPIAWLYTPLAIRLAQALRPSVVVYDCMDELSLFLGAPPELVERERELFAWTDLVFTGGRSLFEAKRRHHSAVHCFPSSVDPAHFGRARRGADGLPPLPDPEDQAGLGHPRLGYYGVIDERLDLALLDALAAARPTWQIVMIGPVVKIDPASLPRHPNLHYLGKRPYESLPAYHAHWDVALLPFALNDSTRFISPTKTLEYMAAEVPIVGTPLADVAEVYPDIVHVAATPADFIMGCERALAPGEERERRRARMRAVIDQTSWEKTVAAMAGLLEPLLPSLPRTARRSTTHRARVLQ